MPTTKTAAASQLVTVRLDAATREAYNALARTSDRTIAQLLRYAVKAFLELPDMPVTRDVPTDSTHTSVRLNADLHPGVMAAAVAHGVTSSDVLRAAAAWWLTTPQPATLGSISAGEVNA